MISDDEFRHLRECGAAWCTEADLSRLLDEVDRLRAENELCHTDHLRDIQESLDAKTKLAKARAALTTISAGACTILCIARKEHMPTCPVGLARHTLKEIDE